MWDIVFVAVVDVALPVLLHSKAWLNSTGIGLFIQKPYKCVCHRLRVLCYPISGPLVTAGFLLMIGFGTVLIQQVATVTFTAAVKRSYPDPSQKLVECFVALVAYHAA